MTFLSRLQKIKLRADIIIKKLPKQLTRYIYNIIRRGDISIYNYRYSNYDIILLYFILIFSYNNYMKM